MSLTQIPGLKPWQQENVWTRFEHGDRSPQIAAEISALYIRILETRSERRSSLHYRSTEDILLRFQELELDSALIQKWRGRTLKHSMINPIIDREYPTRRYEEALKVLGIDPQSIEAKSWTHIEKDLPLTLQ